MLSNIRNFKWINTSGNQFYTFNISSQIWYPKYIDYRILTMIDVKVNLYHTIYIHLPLCFEIEWLCDAIHNNKTLHWYKSKRENMRIKWNLMAKQRLSLIFIRKLISSSKKINLLFVTAVWNMANIFRRKTWNHEPFLGEFPNRF